jgi:mono/diheme cytochrome c family protein
MTYRPRFAFPLAIALSLAAAAAFDCKAGQTGAPGRLQLADSSTEVNTDKPYNITPDGTVDWATFNGYRRFNSNCETCHGFDGESSSFGPRLVDVLKTMPHDKFLEIVANGMQDVNTCSDIENAGAGYQSERDVLHRGHLHLLEGARRRRTGPRPASEARAQAAIRH